MKTLYNEEGNQILATESIDIRPTYFDWNNPENRGRWEMVYPNVSLMRVDECREILEDRGAELPESENRDTPAETFADVESCREWQDCLTQSDKDYADDFCPMANTYYDIPNSQETAGLMQNRLRNSSMVIVIVDKAPKLATRGIGSNMKWEICEAFMALGFLPPLICCDLPMIESHFNERVLQACTQSIKVKIGQCQHTLNTIKSIEARMQLPNSDTATDTLFVKEITVIDPEIKMPVEVSLYKDKASKGIFGIDSSFLYQQEEEEYVIEPFNWSLVRIR